VSGWQLEILTLDRRSPQLITDSFLQALFPNTLEEELEVLIAAGAVPANTPISALEADVQLRNLLDETKDFIDSRDFRSVLRLCLDRVFGIFEETMKPSFGIEDTEDVRFQELSEDGEIGRRVRLAALFPAVAKQSQLAIHGAPNEYVEVRYVLSQSHKIII
jgi:peroxin-3